ncbi:Rz-like spanin [Pseudomonas phage Lana]|uniref:DUF2514 domain-containing protein n=1 Tax=Pseudomonas phage Lana TaxID=2530172 RepID=A0A481W7C2_9CAUD|nr:Rz-like spanin [Pseudomonas phage Lana]QBJ04548.1 hypothetical protein [Pseudomonas phage Lana]
MMFDLRAVIIAALSALVIGAGVGAWVAWGVRATQADLDLLGLRNTYDTATAAAKDESRSAEQALQRQIDDLSEKARDDRHEIDTDVAVAGDTTDGLLHAAANLRYSASACDPGVARRGQAATKAALLYSELLEETQRLAKGLAEEAERTRAAGATCEVAYDGVKQKYGELWHERTGSDR